MEISRKIYLFLMSNDFPLWLAIIFLFGFVIDLTYTINILYSDKTYFIEHESNRLLKYSLSSGNVFIYPLFAVFWYSLLIVISKSYSNIAIRSLFLVLGLLQWGTPIAWKISGEAFFIYYLLIFGVVYYPLFRYTSKK